MGNQPEHGVINTGQFVWLLLIIISAFTAMQVPGLLIWQAGSSAWLSIAAAWFLDTLMAAATSHLGIRFPGENYVQYSPRILGKVLGKVVGLMFIVFFLIVSALVMRGIDMYMGDVFLPRTPKILIVFSAYLVIAYIARHGIEVIARICEILGPLFLLSQIGLILIALPFTHFERLKPQLELGIYPVLAGVLLILCFVGICIAMSWYIPFCNRPENGFLAKFTALSLGSAMIALIVVFGVGILGVQQAGNLTYPGRQLARIIHVDGYFERVEVIWMVIVIGAGIMMAASAVWIVSLSVAQIAGLPAYRPFVYPTALLSFALCMNSFPRNIDFLNFLFYSFPILGLFVETLPLWLLGVALLRGKRGTGEPRSKSG